MQLHLTFNKIVIKYRYILKRFVNINLVVVFFKLMFQLRFKLYVTLQ